ncbi:flagellar hook-length control protein FliK [Pseudoalteromonas sp. G4]|uniref:flagellar hook-length control protein FliK n=1 Tax=Pseudoalteromonas sp. G4 TaxID=2992761 RepID=UPI00237E9D85|nr:flagellar hook-length control protein FliK [Pseudoalteromonas sp. G4]MDE3271174.1 flagellar hook-length control protein FliK [Pseudoalteromonas sp. G4]
MAIIDSQLSVTNLDVGLTSSTSEAENKSSFLAVFESVQTESETKHLDAAKDKLNLFAQEAANESDEVKEADASDIDVVEKVSTQDDSQQNNGEDNSEKILQPVSDMPDKLPSQDDVSITRSKEYQQLVNSSVNQNKEDLNEEDTGQIEINKSGITEIENSERKVSTHVNEFANTTRSALTDANNSAPETEDASAFLDQLTKSQSLNVGLSKTVSEQNTDSKLIAKVSENTINSIEQEGDIKLSQNIITLEKEFAKLDKADLATLKQFFATLDDESSEQLGLSKQDLRQLIEKINIVLERLDSKPLQQNVTLQSVLAKSSKEGVEPEAVDSKSDIKNNDAIKMNEKTQNALSQLIENGKTIIPADKVGTITHPDKQMPHTLTSVGSAVAQAVSNDTENASNVNQKSSDLLNQQVTSQAQTASITQDNKHKQQARVELSSITKQVVSDGEKLDAEIDTDLAKQDNEQPLSFSKLLNSLKNNANTPVLSQLVAQIQSSQLQQAELRDVNQQHIALQTAQVIQNTKQTHASAEQALQQPVNIARSDAAKALFDKANMLLNLNLKEAEIRLDPPELGSMQIRIRSDAEQAQINFVVQSQQAKEMLEQSMGRLREMLAEQGINLGESNVSEQGQSEQQTAENSGSSLPNEGNVESSSEVSEQILSKQQDGIDFYA